jgi:hypothetical protein
MDGSLVPFSIATMAGWSVWVRRASVRWLSLLAVRALWSSVDAMVTGTPPLVVVNMLSKSN